MPAAWIRLLVTAAVLVAVTGCGDGDNGAPHAGKGATSTASAVPGAPEVEVLDTGAEPRERIRLHPENGDTTHATMTMRTSVSQTIDGQASPPLKTPPISLGLLLEVTGVDDDGTIEAKFSYDSVDVKGRGADSDELEDAIKSVVGVHGSLESTDTGAVIDGHFDIPTEAPPFLRSTLSSFESQIQGLTVPFPTEAVGIGAVWTVTTKLEVNGIRTENTMRYRLVDRDGDDISLDVDIEQSARDQDPKIPSLPAGATVHLTRLVNSGSGHVVVERGSMIPVSMTSKVSGVTDMTIEQGGQSGRLVQDTSISLDLSQD